MENKAIIFTQKNTAACLTVPFPSPADDEVLVELAVSTVSSGTERANLTGDTNISVFEQAAEAVFPRTAGYSSSGTVREVGRAITDLKPGDRVALSWSCHQHYLCMKRQNLVKLEPAISFEEAALFHISTFPLAAIRKCRLEIGESAVVMGLGVLGRLAVMQLRNAGAMPVIAVDPVPEKRAQALHFGADAAFDPFDPAFAEQVRAATGGGARVAIEVTGSGKAFDQVLDVMAPKGRVALLGCTRSSDFTIDYYRKIHGPGITVIGAHTAARPLHESSAGWWTQQDDIATSMKLALYDRSHYAALVEETHSPEDAPAVYARLAAESAFPLVQFDWRRLS